MLGKKKDKIYAGDQKEDSFSLEVINQFHSYQAKKTNPYTITEKIITDIDLISFFKYIDRTTSAIGQQYLYSKIHQNEYSKKHLSDLEDDIKYFQTTRHKQDIIRLLSKINTSEDYYFPFLIYAPLPPKIKYLGLVKILQWVSILLVAGAIFFHVLFIPLFLLMALNMGIHYWHKGRIGNFIPIFFRLNRLVESCKRMLPYTERDTEPIEKAISRVASLSSEISYLKTDHLKESEFGSIAWYFLELIKVLTLSEVTFFHKILDHVQDKRKDILTLYQYLGNIDMAISIAYLRGSLPHYCIPEFLERSKSLTIKDSYHPLVDNCTYNDLSLDSKSMLLTGSNMSGKSTFIKALSLNVLSSQVLNTSFAKAYGAPVFALSTSIKIGDNIDEQKSYYLEEVVTIGNMINQASDPAINYLYVIDEVFKGTNTIERISAAKAILSHLNKGNNLVLVSTHDIELTSLLDEEYDLYYFQETVENDQLSFDYKLRSGALKKKNALKILEISGYPDAIVEEARAIAASFEHKNKPD